MLNGEPDSHEGQEKPELHSYKSLAFVLISNMPLHSMQKRAGKKSLNRRIKAAGKYPVGWQFLVFMFGLLQLFCLG